jgi:hypothetical protein
MRKLPGGIQVKINLKDKRTEVITDLDLGLCKQQKQPDSLSLSHSVASIFQRLSAVDSLEQSRTMVVNRISD